ncbi:MAG TPA: zonular occludens toxin domain-containing protein [Candidatus Nanoarchaeia archaeon]|nr:zonular occludens toxin domain-containing protein [Candidatus Nanoarchaeia archaeon]
MGILDIFRKTEKNTNYQPFEVEETKKGDYETFYKKLLNTSLIILIVGKRGSGKTAFGMKLIELFMKKSKRKCYCLGFEEAKLPWSIKKSENIESVPNNSIALIDEGAILFSSRDSMKSPNKELSKFMAIARHKNLTLIIITQNSALVDVNVLRLADTLMFKEPSLLQSTFERKAIKEMYEKASKMFKNKDDKEKYTYVWDDEFEGLLSFSLPEFWNEKISKSFKNLK